MNTLRSGAILVVAVIISMQSSAQVAAVQNKASDNPATWKYEVKRKNFKDYQLIFHLDLKEGWHIWSMKPGGDGMQVVPSFAIDEKLNAHINGNISERGRVTTLDMDGIEGKVTYLSGKIDYVLEVSLMPGIKKITGKHSFQLCDDKHCLAPMEKEFVFVLKQISGPMQ